MTSSAERDRPALLRDFLGFTLSGGDPVSREEAGVCGAGGQVRYAWLDDGVLEFAPVANGAASQPAMRSSVVVSAGVHGDETAPIELLSQLVADVAAGALPLACRLLVVLGNIEAMRAGVRYHDDDLNRLFAGKHTALADSREARRAASLEATTSRFLASATHVAGGRWHIDMHTAIRASAFEQFALLPYTGTPLARAMFDWLADARIEAVMLHTAQGSTYSHFTAASCGALACTLELGKVMPFGQNDLSRFAAADRAVRRLVAGVAPEAAAPMPRVFTVVDQITKRSDAFELLVPADLPNFTPFAKGTVLARDAAYSYTVQRDEERLVFPNPTVKPGLRAGLLVVETTDETLSSLGA